MNTTILVDMDDTMEELLPAWVVYLNNKYHTNVNPNGITDWDIENFFPELTKEQVFELCTLTPSGEQSSQKRMPLNTLRNYRTTAATFLSAPRRSIKRCGQKWTICYSSILTT